MTLDAFSTSGQKNSRDHINILLKPNKGMASYFIRRVEEGLSEEHRVFKIKFPDKAAPLFPNYCVPLAGAIDYYRASHNCVFLPSRSTSGNSPAGKIGLLEPFTDLPDSTTGPFLNKIWKFDESNHYELVSGIVSSVRRSIELGRGVLSGIELCLNEVTDNILLHASRQDDCPESGYVMAQVHKESGRIAIAVYDNGAGIPSSLRSAGYEFDGPEAAILLALQRWRLAPGIGSICLTNAYNLPLKRAYFGNGCSMAFSLRYLGSAACCRVLPRVARRRAGVCAKGGGLPGGGPPLCCG